MRVTASPSPRPRWDGRDWMLLGAATSVAFAIRAIPVLSTSFPLNDGGLFVAMIHALEANHWAVPATVDWNGAAIPFAYPPLGFYVAGLLHVSTGASLEDLLRWIPLAFTTLSVAAVYLLARELLGSRAGAIASALVAAGAPAAFAWPLDGGGVTRAPGIVLALLAIWAGAHVIARPGPRRGLVLASWGASRHSCIRPRPCSPRGASCCSWWRGGERSRPSRARAARPWRLPWVLPSSSRAPGSRS